MAVATSFTVPNYSGALYTKSNTQTPFLNLIGAPRTTKSVEFVLNQEYVLGTPSQPSISEKASQTAPEATSIARTQKTNVTQIFQRTVGVTYAKESNMGTLDGANIAGQQENPTSELDFQTAACMQQTMNDIEFTCIRGTYNKAATDDEVNKTRGILEGIVTNAVKETNKVSSSSIRSVLNAFFKTLYDANTDIDGYTLMMNSDIKAALTEAYAGSNLITPNGFTLAGANVMDLITDFGNMHIVLTRTMPQDTLLCFNPAVCHLVEQPHPKMGNFFLKPLGTTGAAEKYMLYGQVGLDYGFEKLHGKLTFGTT